MMAERYYRLVTFVIDVSAVVLRELLMQCARNDPNVTYTSLQEYMNHRKKKVKHLFYAAKVLSRRQYDLVFPLIGECDENNWDVTLLAVLITNLFPNETFLVQTHINTLRMTRNDMQHSPATQMDEREFNTNWSKLERACMAIANTVTKPNFQVTVQTQIDTLKALNMNSIAKPIMQWCISVLEDKDKSINELNEKVATLQSTIDEMRTGQDSLRNTVTDEVVKPIGKLKGAAVKRMDRHGVPSKRMKIDNEKCNKMKQRFKKAVSQLPSEFQHCQEIDDAKDRDHIVVTGVNLELCMKHALSAFQLDKDDLSQCALLTSLDQVVELNNDVRVAVLDKPFSRKSFTPEDHDKVKERLDDLEEEKENGMRVVIVETTDILESIVEQGFQHELLKGRILIHGSIFDTTRDSIEAYATALSKLTETTFQKEDVDTIRMKVVKVPLLVITGSCDSKCMLQSTINAVKDNFEARRCAILSDAGFWEKVDESSLDLVIFYDPFGRTVYYDDKAKAFVDLINNIHSKDVKPKIVVVSEKDLLGVARTKGLSEDILDECIVLKENQHEHGNYIHLGGKDDVVTVPANPNSNIRYVNSNQLQKNLQDITETWILRGKSIPPNDKAVAATRTLMVAGKPVVLLGQRDECLSIVASVIEDSPTRHCLVVQNPGHVYQLSLDKLSLLVVKDFAGARNFQESHAQKWEQVFDVLDSYLVARKLSVIMTSGNEVFQDCKNFFGPLPWFDENCVVSVEPTAKDTKPPPSQASIKLASVTLSPMSWINMKTKEDILNCSIEGMAILPPGRLLMCDSNNNSIKCVNMTNNTITSCLKLSSQPWDVTLLPDNQAAITVPRTAEIQVFSTSGNMSIVRTFNVGNYCRGIRCVKDKLVVSFTDTTHKVEIMDYYGKVLQTITTGTKSQQLFNYPFYLAVSQENNRDVIYVSNWDNNTIVKLDMDGRDLFTYTGQDLQRPYGLAVTRAGEVLVCSVDKHQVHLLSSTGEKIRTLLSSSDGLNYPHAICVAEVEKKLFVSNAHQDKVQVYKIN